MKKPASPQLVTVIIIGVALVMIAACTSSTPQQSQNTNTQPTQAAPVKAEAPAAPATPPAAAAAVIASADGEAPGARVEIHELKRTSGDTLTLRFSMVNGGTKEISFGYSFAEKGKDVPDFASVGGVHLIDPVGKKKYFVVRDTEDQPSCSRGLKDLDPGGRLNLWSKFPAPPEDVQVISVVVPHFGPMDDVPISR